MALSRREFMLSSAGLGAFLLTPREMSLFAAEHSSLKTNFNTINPISKLNAFRGTETILGDTPDEAHDVFWDKAGFLRERGGLPRSVASYDVVIIGGGLSGLISAYHLSQLGKKVLILEGHPQLGGNARAEQFKNTYMAMGSAYVTIPEKDGLIESFYKDIGVYGKFRQIKKDKGAVLLNGRLVEDFWNGATDKSMKDNFTSVYQRLNQIYDEEYPELPLIPGLVEDRTKLHALDKLKFSKWCEGEFGALHPHIEEYFHQYCWSSFGCAYDDISAAQALNFITSDMQGTQALPGGNALIAQAIVEKIKNGSIAFVGKSFCVDIRETDKGVYIAFHDQNSRLSAVTAKKCIVTAPKMVSKYLIDDLSKQQRRAMNDMRYHAYLVGNVLLKKNLKLGHYDLYSLLGEIPSSEYRDSKDRSFSDITFANWANENQAEHQALTLYMPLPYDMAQQYLFSPVLYEKYTGRLKKVLKPFFSQVGLDWDKDVEGLRLTRYGHALPVPQAGNIANGVFERAAAPINNKIFFANQDNWGNPCVETCFAVGTLAAYQAAEVDLEL